MICAEAGDGPAAVQAMAARAPDILFLDIEMPGMSGLEVARKASGRCHVVFVTAYDKYAIEAFEQGAVDYVMKPISPLRLEATVERLKARLQEPPADLNGILQAITTKLGTRKEYLRWITASHTDGLRLITVDSICYFRADNKYTSVVTADSESLIRRPLKILVEEVDPQTVLADPPLGGGQREHDRRGRARRTRPPAGSPQDAQGDAAGGRVVSAAVQADVRIGGAEFSR